MFEWWDILPTWAKAFVCIVAVIIVFCLVLLWRQSNMPPHPEAGSSDDKKSRMKHGAIFETRKRGNPLRWTEPNSLLEDDTGMFFLLTKKANPEDECVYVRRVMNGTNLHPDELAISWEDVLERNLRPSRKRYRFQSCSEH